MTNICYSDGRMIPSVIQIWDDLHNERAGYFRAFWCNDRYASTGSPVVGYCSPGGSHRTMKAAIAECRRLGHTDPIYRNGRQVA